jgi:hypothetical protein
MGSDDTFEGLPALDRQVPDEPRDARGRRLVPQRVPELQPTPLQGTFIYLSIVALICGVVAITALELGTPMSSPIVKLSVLLGGVILLAVNADALVRVRRSVAAWRPVDAGRARFRLVWATVLAGSLVVIAAIMLAILLA